MCAKVAYHVNCGAWCFEQAHRFFVLSYRHPRIVGRAAKKFGRMVRAGKVHESPQSVVNWAEYKKKYDILEHEEILGIYEAY